MDASEQIVFEYLSARGFDSVVYEPDGKVPPDFLVNARIAIEVRRLNQHDETATGPRGLEVDAYPLDAKFRRVLQSLGPPIHGESWFVCYDFRRPLPLWKDLETALRAQLTAFRNGPIRNARTLKLARRFKLNILRASQTHPHLFMLGGSGDGDSGGFVLAEMDRNIRICVEDKNRKVARVRDRYPEWWLALVDRIGYGQLSEDEQTDLRRILQVDHRWHKILLVSPLDPQRGFEL